MSKKPLIKLLTSDALPLETVKLGRLLIDRKQPWQSYCSFSLISPNEDEFSGADFDHVKDESEESSSWDVVGAVGNFFEAMFNSEKKLARKLNTDHTVVWRLHNSPDYLERLCNAQFVRNWLQRRIDIDLKRVYLVTGLITVEDAAMNRDASSSTTAGVKFQPPVTDLASHGLSEALPKKAAEALDPKVTLKKGATAKAKISLDAPGIRVTAVEYTRVRLRKHSSADLKNKDIFLDEKSSRWTDTFRGTGAGDDVIFEAYIGPGDEESEEDEDSEGDQDGVDEGDTGSAEIDS
jgi:hypothetical protein